MSEIPAARSRVPGSPSAAPTRRRGARATRSTRPTRSRATAAAVDDSSLSERPLVTAVIVAHDGGRWVSECIDGLAAQTVVPQRVVAVDTGSRDDTAAQLAARLGESAVVRLPRDAGLAAAVTEGVAAFAGAPAPAGSGTAPTEWIWLLHDDCLPQPDALAALLARADGSPSTWAVGPKVCDWSGDRLLEVGVTVDRLGHRETWLDSRELDQGQADDRGEALAAGTAGLLIRREAWDRLGGMDDLGWPGAEDIDFGWRIRAAGGRVALAPGAVVRHVAAARLPDSARPPGAVRRNRAMRVVLANYSGLLAVLLWLRLVGGAPLRALGWLLARRPTAARDELVAALRLLGAVGDIRRARAERQPQRVVPHRELRRSLAGVSDRVRHVVDAVRGTGGAGRHRGGAETGPIDERAESLPIDDAASLRRLLTRPGVAVFVGVGVLAAIADRSLFAAHLAGGHLLPTPEGASGLWSGYLAAWHPAGVGTAAPAPPGLGLLALLATICFGHAPLAVALLMLLTVPLAALAAWHASGALTADRLPRMWAAVAWSVLPVATGAVAGGRIDGCVAAILLPLVARAVLTALRRLSAPSLAGGWSGCVGAGLLLGVMTACAPVAWPVCVVAGIAAIAIADRPGVTRRLAGFLLVAVVGFLVCIPWSVSLLLHPAGILAGFGLPELHRPTPLPTDLLLLLQPGGPAQPPLWTSAALLLAAAAGLFRSSRAARVTWTVLLVGLAATVVVTRVHGVAFGDPASRAWGGVPLLVASAGAIAAAVIAADRAPRSLSRRTFGIAQPVSIVVAALALVAVGWAAVGWAVRGAGRPLAARPAAAAPVFVADALAGATSPRALILTGRNPVRIALARRPVGIDLAAGAVAGAAPGGQEAPARHALQQAVRDLLAGRSAAVRELADFGVTYLVASGRAAGPVSRGAVAVGGFHVTRISGVLVLHSPAPAGELTVAGAGPVRALPASDTGTAHVTLAAASTARRLLLAEPADSHWHATLAGRPLPAVRSGWQQAFTVPAGAGGQLEVGYSAPARGVWLVVELIVIAGLVLLALPMWRLQPRDPDAAPPGEPAEPARRPAGVAV